MLLALAMLEKGEVWSEREATLDPIGYMAPHSLQHKPQTNIEDRSR